MDDPALGVWVGFSAAPKGAFLAELMKVYFTEFTDSLDLSGSPISEQANCLMGQLMPILNPILQIK